MELKKQIEALLFASGRKMLVEELGRLLHKRKYEEIKALLQELKNDYEKREGPLMLVEDGNEWKLTTREKYLDIVREINPHTELSKTMIETLAVIAWKQPMLQSDVIKIRTNKAYDHIKGLEEMGYLVKEKYGRTYLLKLSQKFFDYFELRNDESLKALFKEIKEEVAQKVDTYKAETKDTDTKDIKKEINEEVIEKAMELLFGEKK